jgi:hypothetical protein
MEGLVLLGLLVGLGILFEADSVRGQTVEEIAPRAGTRLVPIFLQADDGARQFVGWFDTARAEECSYALSGDGLIRCLPTAIAEARWFLDATCVRPIAAVSAYMPPHYLVVAEPTAHGCSTDLRHHVYQAGRTIHLSAWYERVGGACAPVPLPANPKDIFIEAGTAIAPSAFVAAKYVARGPQTSLKTAYDATPSQP